jgi:hypothetical protein
MQQHEEYNKFKFSKQMTSSKPGEFVLGTIHFSL